MADSNNKFSKLMLIKKAPISGKLCLKAETEGFIMDAQDQILARNYQGRTIKMGLIPNIECVINMMKL